MASLCVEYLHGRASHAEWPASPDRLFQAMIAAAYANGLQERALPWLESLCGQRPAITAPAPEEVTRWTTSVPVAFMPKSGKDGKYVNRAIVGHSVRYLRERTRVWYHWDLPEDLAELVGNVRYVGKREDMTRCWLDSEPPPPNLLPMAEAEIELPVPQLGRLKQLQDYRRIAVKAPAAPLTGYGTPVEASPWGEMFLKRPGAVWSLTEARILARQFGRALLAQFDENAIPSWVHVPERGHKAYVPHLACIAIPETGEKYRDRRRLVGVGAILPKTHEVDRLLLVRKLDKIADMPWDDEGLDSFKDRHWLGPSPCWETVTPVVFPRYGKRPGDLEMQLAGLLERQGYPSPESVEIFPDSPTKGIPPAAAYLRRNPDKPVFHARIAWAGRQAGPVLIGQESHYGLGLFTPVRQR